MSKLETIFSIIISGNIRFIVSYITSQTFLTDIGAVKNVKTVIEFYLNAIFEPPWAQTVLPNIHTKFK